VVNSHGLIFDLLIGFTNETSGPFYNRRRPSLLGQHGFWTFSNLKRQLLKRQFKWVHCVALGVVRLVGVAPLECTEFKSTFAHKQFKGCSISIRNENTLLASLISKINAWKMTILRLSSHLKYSSLSFRKLLLLQKRNWSLHRSKYGNCYGIND